jgi:hypothetical protein
MDRQATEKSERELGDVTIVQKLGYAIHIAHDAAC